MSRIPLEPQSSMHRDQPSKMFFQTSTLAMSYSRYSSESRSQRVISAWDSRRPSRICLRKYLLLRRHQAAVLPSGEVTMAELMPLNDFQMASLAGMAISG